MTVNREFLLPETGKVFSLDTSLATDILLLHLFPGMNEALISHLLDYDGLKGVIMLSFGSGNAPSSPSFLNILEKKTSSGIPIVNITQCMKGAVSQGDYQVSEGLERIGVISGRDMTKEAAVTKMMHLLGVGAGYNEFKKLFENDLRGEISTIIIQ